jgi:hypothetical protein
MGALMKTALLWIVLPLALAACVRAPQQPASAAAPPPVPSASTGTPASPAAPLSVLPPEERILYYPSRDRVLTTGDQSSNDVQWKPVGVGFADLLGRVLHGLVLTDTEITDRDANPKGTLLPAGSRLEVREASDWANDGSGFRRLYRVESPDKTVGGWIRAGAVALILAQARGLEAGVLLRKVVVGGGESEYNLLVVADGDRVTVMDTSYLPFPDDFHPSGILSISLDDVNADSRAEVIVEAETILSLRYLGATPVRWKAWLRRGVDGALVPIFLYNMSFGSDAGYSYSATDRLFDSSGGGFRDIVRVDTDYTVVSGTDEFRTSTVSFYPWNGSQFRHAALQDLPRLGTVTAEQAALRAEPGPDATQTAALSHGDQLYVFDRSDKRQARDDPSSWWYRAVTRSGAAGWVSGTDLELSWIDPLKVNREAFLGSN